MTTFVLVPGAWHGGWWYEPLVARLVAAGHRAVAVTPSGLDPEAPPSDRAVNLDQHVAEVTAAVRAAAGTERDVVLVGHSYGGCLINGAADAVPERVRALVYLDAFVPEDGDSCWSMANDEERGWYVTGAARNGFLVDPLSFLDERARPHPLGTLMQASKLTGAWRGVPVKHYVAAMGWPGESPLAATTARVRADPTFVVHEWDTGHNVLRNGPDQVYDLIVEL
jgi:pimeloyl-ACP methyl ester carboxylesterase